MSLYLRCFYANTKLMLLHLDPNFKPSAGEEISFDSFCFSGGEPHIKIHSALPSGAEVLITHRIRSFNDLGLLCMAVDALRRCGVQHIELFIPYFPGARQDRVMVPGEPLSVKVYADLINNLALRRVYVFDPHSDVAPALLQRCMVLQNHDFIREVLQHIGSPVALVAPDGGAFKKIFSLSAALEIPELVTCGKSRDVATGQLTRFQVFADDLKGQDCLIVDDICDGGSTFIGLADALRGHNAGRLFLAVSHGIFSRGIAPLRPHFDTIFCTNAFCDISAEGVIQIPIHL
jgi:ribose-phosphate pyrophosphokinase